MSGEVNAIPEMTDPHGRYWDQPKDLREALMDDHHVILTPAQIAGLMSYNHSYPSGVYVGKCWLRSNGDKRWLVWYGEGKTPATCSLDYREVLLMECTESRGGAPEAGISQNPGEATGGEHLRSIPHEPGGRSDGAVS